jgi:PAS domain-containing protein
MPSHAITPQSQVNLRKRALSRLTGHNGQGSSRARASTALGVLHELASSPATAADALALLHELQVYQVELELQDEELSRSRAELEATFVRQAQLYDFAPVGCFTIDRDTTICELNLTGAHLLDVGRDALVGQSLNCFLSSQSSRALEALLTRVAVSNTGAVGTLQLTAVTGATRTVQVAVNADPAGRRFLVAIIETGKNAETASA